MSISKSQQARLQELHTLWIEATARLRHEEARTNEVLAQAEKSLNVAIQDLNDLVLQANLLRDEIVEKAQATFDKRSIAWMDSEKGCAYADWIDAWRNEVEPVESFPLERIELADDFADGLLPKADYPLRPSVVQDFE